MTPFEGFWTKVDQLTALLNHEQSVEEFERELILSEAFSGEHTESSFAAMGNVSSASGQAVSSAPKPRR